MCRLRPALRLAQEVGARLGDREVLFRALSHRAGSIRHQAERDIVAGLKMTLGDRRSPPQDSVARTTRETTIWKKVVADAGIRLE